MEKGPLVITLPSYFVKALVLARKDCVSGGDMVDCFGHGQIQSRDLGYPEREKFAFRIATWCDWLSKARGANRVLPPAAQSEDGHNTE
jgi:hypothetical protein